MSELQPLLPIERIDTEIEPYLSSIGEIFRAFRHHDSGCTSLGVRVNGQAWFVKYSTTPRSITWLKRAVCFHSIVEHRALPRLHTSFESPNGFALVYDWVEGECLRPTYPPGYEPDPDEIQPRERFCALPAEEIIAVLNIIYDAHLTIASHGFIAVDFYDGCMIYDFEKKEMHLCDFDHYHPGPFINEMGRMYGSSRFMAPEEFQRGERIDETTNVCTLGRTAFVLLGNNTNSKDSWKGTDEMWQVAERATSPDRRLRHQSVREFVEDWTKEQMNK